MLGNSALAQLALAEFPQKLIVSGVSTVAETLTFSDAFRAVQVSTVNVSETLVFVDTETARRTTFASDTETLTLVDTITGKRTTTASDTETLTLTDTETGKRTTYANTTESIALQDVCSPIGQVSGHCTETIGLQDTVAAILRTSANITETIALLDVTDATVISGALGVITETISPIDLTDGTVISGKVIDTHDGVRKKKKKKKDFAEEIDRREKLRKQITEVIHPVIVPVEEPEIKSIPEVVETKPFEIKTTVSPAVDYAGLAKREIVDKLKQDAELKARQAYEAEQLRIQAEIEDEDELEMILEALL